MLRAAITILATAPASPMTIPQAKPAVVASDNYCLTGEVELIIESPAGGYG